MAVASHHSVRNLFVGQGAHRDITRSCWSHGAQLPSQSAVSRRRAEISESQEKIVINYIKSFNLTTPSSYWTCMLQTFSLLWVDIFGFKIHSIYSLYNTVLHKCISLWVRLICYTFSCTSFCPLPLVSFVLLDSFASNFVSETHIWFYAYIKSRYLRCEKTCGIFYREMLLWVEFLHKPPIFV